MPTSGCKVPETHVLAEPGGVHPAGIQSRGCFAGSEASVSVWKEGAVDDLKADLEASNPAPTLTACAGILSTKR